MTFFFRREEQRGGICRRCSICCGTGWTACRRKLESDRDLLGRRFAELDFGASGARRLTLRGATLLHVAAEYGNLDAAMMLLDRGADVNARADVDAHGVGGQTPIFHAATQHFDFGLPMVELLLKRGADLSVRAKLPGHYERPEEWVECTPVEYAGAFSGKRSQGKRNQYGDDFASSGCRRLRCLRCQTPIASIWFLDSCGVAGRSGWSICSCRGGRRRSSRTWRRSSLDSRRAGAVCRWLPRELCR